MLVQHKGRSDEQQDWHLAHASQPWSLMEEDAAADRPFIAALAISKARGGLPELGFFDCARRLGRFSGDPDGQAAWSFHAAELNAVFAQIGRASCRERV